MAKKGRKERSIPCQDMDSDWQATSGWGTLPVSAKPKSAVVIRIGKSPTSHKDIYIMEQS